MGSEGDSDDEDEDEEALAAEADAMEIETAVLCSLTYGKIEQTTVDVVLPAEREYLVQVVGKNPVHLLGNYIDQRPPDSAPYSDEEDSDDEDAHDLREVSSDVEVYPDELDVDEGRFEEIVEDEPPKESSKKRPRESDATDSGKLSKAEKKKQKKQKGENGEAVEPPTPAKEEKGKKEKKEKGDKEKKPKGETKTLQGGVQAADHKIGTGPKAKAGDAVSVRYIGKLQNGKVFDQNKSGKPFTFRLGKGEVIKGWDIGVAGMQAGGERLLTIPAPMAYGKKAQQGIPANSTLIFEVRLVEIK